VTLTKEKVTEVAFMCCCTIPRLRDNRLAAADGVESVVSDDMLSIEPAHILVNAGEVYISLTTAKLKVKDKRRK
jgi:hypothetical protein